MKYFWSMFFVFIFLCGLCFVLWPKSSQYKTTTLMMGGEKFTTQIADTSAFQQLGLSYRKSLGQNEAMLFVFQVPDKYPFWMKDMNFPLDIIWLDTNKKIVYIGKNLSPSTYPQTFGPDNESQYVVEVVAGTAERLKLKNGDAVSF